MLCLQNNSTHVSHLNGMLHMYIPKLGSVQNSLPCTPPPPPQSSFLSQEKRNDDICAVLFVRWTKSVGSRWGSVSHAFSTSVAVVHCKHSLNVYLELCNPLTCAISFQQLCLHENKLEHTLPYIPLPPLPNKPTMSYTYTHTHTYTHIHTIHTQRLMYVTLQLYGIYVNDVGLMCIVV